MIALRSSAACWIVAAAAVALVFALGESPSTTAPALQLHERVEAVRTSSDVARVYREHAQSLRMPLPTGVLEDSIVDLPRHDPGY